MLGVGGNSARIGAAIRGDPLWVGRAARLVVFPTGKLGALIYIVMPLCRFVIFVICCRYPTSTAWRRVFSSPRCGATHAHGPRSHLGLGRLRVTHIPPRYLVFLCYGQSVLFIVYFFLFFQGWEADCAAVVQAVKIRAGGRPIARIGISQGGIPAAAGVLADGGGGMWFRVCVYSVHRIFLLTMHHLEFLFRRSRPVVQLPR